MIARIWAVLLLLLPHASLYPQSGEYTVKAVFIERFTRYIEWPDSTAFSPAKSDSFVLGVIGRNPFGDLLKNIFEKQPIKNRPVTIRQIENLSQVDSCQVLFIGRSKSRHLVDILKITEKRPILTIGDTQGYAEQGVLINFFLDGNNIRFEINETAVRNAGLYMDYRLLRMSKIIQRGGK